VFAEDAYFFRHSLLRDAAYSLQPPSFRAFCHSLVVESFLHIHNNNPPGVMAAEISGHAGLALEDGLKSDRLMELRLRFLLQAMEHARLGYQLADVVTHADAITRLDWIDSDRLENSLLVAAEYCDRSGQRLRASEYVNRAIELQSESSPQKHRVKALMLHSVICIHQAKYREAEVSLTRLTEMDEAGISKSALAVALGNLAIVHREIGRNDLAEAEYRRAIDLSRIEGDNESVGRNLGNLANLLRDQGRLNEAGEAFIESLRLTRRAEDLMTEGIILGNYSEILMMQKKYDEARDAILNAQKIQVKLGDIEGESQSKSNLAKVCAEEGDLNAAVELSYEAISGLEFAESPFLATGARCRLARYLMESGRIEEAKSECRIAEAESKRMGAREFLIGQLLPIKIGIALSSPLSPEQTKVLLAEVNDAIGVLPEVGLGPDSLSASNLADCKILLKARLE
jgi:tetratricopeptide (TPR) repeat protein